ncbi:MAG: hypothetical protein ACRD2J_05150 [Thermoanaerobaculia bacterium]
MTASSRRGRSENGFALIAALLIAILFFSLMELTLRDTTDAIRRVHAFRARVSAEILADNAAELAAEGMLSQSANQIEVTTEAGRMTASYTRNPGDVFEITAEGTSSGPIAVSSRVVLRGRIDGSNVRILESTTR